MGPLGAEMGSLELRASILSQALGLPSAWDSLLLTHPSHLGCLHQYSSFFKTQLIASPQA